MGNYFVTGINIQYCYGPIWSFEAALVKAVEVAKRASTPSNTVYTTVSTANSEVYAICDGKNMFRRWPE